MQEFKGTYHIFYWSVTESSTISVILGLFALGSINYPIEFLNNFYKN